MSEKTGGHQEGDAGGGGGGVAATQRPIERDGSVVEIPNAEGLVCAISVCRGLLADVSSRLLKFGNLQRR